MAAYLRKTSKLNFFVTVVLIIIMGMLPFFRLVISMLERNPEASFGFVFFLALLGSMLLLVSITK